jgi:hypothetical protein
MILHLRFYLFLRTHLTVVSRLLRQHRYRPWLESAGERPITMDQRKLVIATERKVVPDLSTLHSTFVADDQRENGTRQTYR